MQSKSDLHNLARQAYAEIQQTANRSRRVGTGNSDGAPARVAIAVLLGLIIVAGGWHFGVARLSTNASAKTLEDLDGVLAQARDALEEARRATRALPEAIPRASLAAVVRYERYVSDSFEESYRLSASSGGVTVLLDSSGNREVRRTDR